jgi:hypothetical protein
MEIDREVYEVEERIARRREEIVLVARASGERAMQSLASPVALGTAVVVGFVAGGLIGRRRKKNAKFVERRRVERSAAKKTGLAGLLGTAAMALIKARYGSPVALAQMLWERMRAPGEAPATRVPRGAPATGRHRVPPAPPPGL